MEFMGKEISSAFCGAEIKSVHYSRNNSNFPDILIVVRLWPSLWNKLRF